VRILQRGRDLRRDLPGVIGAGPPGRNDLAPDDKRLAAFVADDASGDKPPTHLTFLINFFDQLRRRAPTGK
jgi:hypothetical protein